MIQINPSRLGNLLKDFSGKKILVVGDLMLDEFIWGTVERISPEAPVPIIEVVRESLHLGGCANVVANLAALGAEPLTVGVIGNDSGGERLVSEMVRQKISVRGLIRDAERSTSVKTRIIAHRQQVCRADRETRKPLSNAIQAQLMKTSLQLLGECDGLILSDYSKGVLHPELIGHLIDRCRESGKFVSVDPKTMDFSVYRSASIITPNKKEAEQASGITITDDSTLFDAGTQLLRATRADYLLITRGEEGMTLFQDGRQSHIPTVAREVFDVTGAGDTVVATLTLAVVAGATVAEAAFLANHAAGVVVGKVGTACATREEIGKSVNS
ncbi:MAG: D-glycero-beta-D-manno-heptose-7-phosphate kinase [Acidobacteria bacterium]|nr:D-glycero-beta-D-manno-heptose-7-phosphate kinase [Acidobacteriota bacterium]